MNPNREFDLFVSKNDAPHELLAVLNGTAVGRTEISILPWIVVLAVTTQIALTAEGAEVLKCQQSSGIR